MLLRHLFDVHLIVILGIHSNVIVIVGTLVVVHLVILLIGILIALLLGLANPLTIHKESIQPADEHLYDGY